jgi:CMP-N-acetylneuraminic acid synthetase
VSSDHPEILQAAKAAGLDAPFVRPKALSGDIIGDFDVLIHALEATEADDRHHYDIIVMLQPTSPLRTPAQVSATIRRLVEGGWDSVWTVSPTDSKMHPLKQLTVDPDGALSYYDSRGALVVARQQLSPVYHRNGIAYVMTRECLVQQRTIIGRQAAAFVIEDEHVSIDTERDIAAIEWKLSNPEK